MPRRRRQSGMEIGAGIAGFVPVPTPSPTTTTGRLPSENAGLSQPPRPLERGTWSLTRGRDRIVICVKGDDGTPAMLSITAREAVKFAQHLLANAEGVFAEDDLRGIRPT